MKKHLFFLLSVCLILSIESNAQIQVESPQGMTPEQLVLSTLVLPPIVSGVYISNAKFNNSFAPLPTTTASKIGIFTNGFNFTDFPMFRGIIMTTGNITVATGPNNNGSSSAPNNDGTTDANLQALTTASITGMSKLEFDFISVSGNVQFEYIFASEEYPEFVCSSFNDIFAFFLTGLHPVTGVQSTWNIAIIPGTTLPVTINTLNNGISAGSASNCNLSYSSFYNAVPTGSTGMQFDGFTKIPANSPHSPFGIPLGLLAKSRIVPCASYHMKLAIGNVTDNSYDSGVFLKQGSFISPSEFKNYHSFTIPTDPTLVQNSNSDTIYYLILPPDSTRDYTVVAFADSAQCDAVFNEDYEFYYLDPLGDTLVKSDDFITAFPLPAGAAFTKLLIRVPETAVFEEGQVKTLKLVLKVETCPGAQPIVDTMFFSIRARHTGEFVEEFTSSLVTINPNPSDGKFNIKHLNSVIEEISVFDLSGRKVGYYTQLNTQEYTLDINNYAPGIYFVKLKTNEGTIVKKIMKQ